MYSSHLVKLLRLLREVVATGLLTVLFGCVDVQLREGEDSAEWFDLIATTLWALVSVVSAGIGGRDFRY